jgi:7-cyano-7-deazaguanine synthase
MAEKKAVVLLSGGLDSAVTAYAAKADGRAVIALTVDYGQRHKREIECARKIAEAVGALEHKVIQLDLTEFGGSALTDPKIEVPDSCAAGIPATYVPARNTILLSLALAYAEAAGADEIHIGVNSVDYSGYPDCRPRFIRAFQELAYVATKRAVEGAITTVKTPLISLSKKQIIELGARLGVPFELTTSCYRGGKRACGTCASCRLRREGFKQAGVKDPIEYD